MSEQPVKWIMLTNVDCGAFLIRADKVSSFDGDGIGRTRVNCDGIERVVNEAVPDIARMLGIVAVEAVNGREAVG